MSGLKANSGNPRKPVFKNYGGYYQLCISTPEDLDYLLTLDDGRWMATSCPIFGLRVDAEFLELLDLDGNGRIVSDEVRTAVRWMLDRLNPSKTWMAREVNLPLNLIKEDHPEGSGLKGAAVQVLESLDLKDASQISPDQVKARLEAIAQSLYNGDGLIPPQAIEDPDASEFANDLIATLGGSPDADGNPNLDEAILDRFVEEAEAYLKWHGKSLVTDGGGETDLMPFGTMTPKIFASITTVRDQVDRFYAQCALVRFDHGMADLMGLGEEERSQIDYGDRDVILERLSRTPLARPNGEGILHLDGDVNHFHHDLVETLQKDIVAPILGEDKKDLSEVEWNEIKARFSQHEAWIGEKPETPLETLGADKLRSYLDGECATTLRALIEEDKAVAEEVKILLDLKKLILYHQWLFEFVNNFVGFPHLFDPGQKAMFEMGTLVLEGREFTFSIKVKDRTLHSNLAKNSGIFLLYLTVSGSNPEEDFEIAVPLTSGGSHGFYIGRQGVFFTTDGRELDARIVGIIDNPISLWESMKAPIRNIQNLITRRFEGLTTIVQKEAETSIGTTAARVETSIQGGLRAAPRAVTTTPAPTPSAPSGNVPPARPETPPNSGNVRDFMIGTGFLVAGLGTAFKFLADTAKQLTNPQTLLILVTVLAIFFIITVTIMALSAWARLRRRDLGVLLQASGWAINGKMRLTASMARLFTRKTLIPKGARKRSWKAVT